MNNKNYQLISLKEVSSLTTMSRYLVMALANDNRFPKHIKLTGNKRIAFVRSEVMSWIDEKIISRNHCN